MAKRHNDDADLQEDAKWTKYSEEEKYQRGKVLYYSKDRGEVRRIIIVDVDETKEESVFTGRDTCDHSFVVEFTQGSEAIFDCFSQARRQATEWKAVFKKDFIRCQEGDTVYTSMMCSEIVCPLRVKRVRDAKSDSIRYYTLEDVTEEKHMCEHTVHGDDPFYFAHREDAQLYVEYDKKSWV